MPSAMPATACPLRPAHGNDAHGNQMHCTDHSGSSAPGIPGDGGVPFLHSNDLLQGRKTVAIAHNGLVYRLQATRLGKLILTK